LQLVPFSVILWVALLPGEHCTNKAGGQLHLPKGGGAYAIDDNIIIAKDIFAIYRWT
jgi:hypothetical protein